MANKFIENGDHDLAPIVADLQKQLEELENLRQSSENANEDYKNECIVYKKCKKVINDRDNEEKEVSWWPQNLFIHFNVIKNLVWGFAMCFIYYILKKTKKKFFLQKDFFLAF